MFLDNIINNNNKISNRSNYKYKGNLIQNIENIDHNFIYCDQDGCNYKCKRKNNLKRHKAVLHDIGVTWFHCDQYNCNYKVKQKSNLKKHKASKHDIGVTWFNCDQDGCNYKSKKKSNLKTHKRKIDHQNNLFQTNKKVKTEAS